MKFNDIVLLIEDEESILVAPGNRVTYYSTISPNLICTHKVTEVETAYVDAQNLLHRVGAPAISSTSNMDGAELDVYLVHGRIHRPDGPARITHKNGNVLKEEYYLHGEECSKEKYDAFYNGISDEHRSTLDDMTKGFE